MTDATRGSSAPIATIDQLPDPRATAEAVLFEIRRVIVGQHQMLERVLVALLADGHVLLEGVPGLAKTLTIRTLADALDASFRRIQFTPDLRPRRSRRDAGSTTRDRATFDTELGPVFCQLPAGGRDQPRPGQGAVGAARGHAGAPGHDRRREPPAAQPVPRDGHPEPHRVRGHLPAPRGAGGPLPHEGRGGLPHAGRGGDGRRALAAPRRRGPPRPGRRRSRSAPGRDAGHLRGPGDRRLRGGDRGRDPRACPIRPGGPRPVHRVRRQPPRLDQPDPRRAGPRADPRAPIRHPAGRGRAARDVLRHRIVPSFTALAEGVTPDRMLDSILPAVPAPRLITAEERSA